MSEPQKLALSELVTFFACEIHDRTEYPVAENLTQKSQNWCSQKHRYVSTEAAQDVQ